MFKGRLTTLTLSELTSLEILSNLENVVKVYKFWTTIRTLAIINNYLMQSHKCISIWN